MVTKGDRKTFRNEELVLKVSPDVDPKKWDESKYEAFLDELCGVHHQYQAEAIRTTLRYLLGGRYANLRELARENFEENDSLQERYGSFAAMEAHLQLPDQLSCSLDIATGAGKSYVLYGLAAILLAEGIVDRVLVLCPSTTIESGLMEKFRALSSNADLQALLPPTARVSAPSIVDASETIAAGAICVENYHAILEHVGSSVRDSLKGKGARTAVLSDEAHHIANEAAGKVKVWKSFLLDPDFDFRFHVGVSGTCYVGDEYFADVVSRYSIRQAIEDRVVKRIEYVAEVPATANSDEWWQLIYKRHADLKKRLKSAGIRPLTIVVTKTIPDCNRVAEELRNFIEEWAKTTSDHAAELVIPVTSAREHQVYLAKLREVDSPTSKVEWIVSVSMLTEGWDVKNVFQIVPHNERAFNSKLLISQVLGRGLRVPLQWKGEQATVTVFNHDSWAPRIRQLVNEVLEFERRLSSVVDKRSSYNFDLHQLDYTQEETKQELTRKTVAKLFEHGYVDLPTQVDTEDVVIEFEGVVGAKRSKFKTQLEHKTYSAEEVAEHIFNRLLSIDQESQASGDSAEVTNYTQKMPLQKCLAVVRESLKRAGIASDRVTEDNRQRFLQALGSLSRRKGQRIVFTQRANALRVVSTRERQADSCSAAELRRQSKTVFYGPKAEAPLNDEQRQFLQEVKDPDGEFVAGREEVAADVDFRSPLNLAIADATPERKFIRELCKRDNAKVIDGWLKNTSQGFYWVEYAWKKGSHTKRGEFSPDFFLKQGSAVLVVEIKDDSEIADPSPENAKKYEHAVKHFERVNEWLEREGIGLRYQMNFLTPKDINKFFQKMREGTVAGFRSEIDLALAAASSARDADST
ncbi:DEAD/DEAH box helicase [Hyalangium rubrum]|uniref:DEAD/DEAH box helicase family protein n=1 Tax=Hyalangium rubrum TaxID=3103134 RepID=A0ABU5HIM8_9BACT|nr:DEAD/DEAH box helicase family protein [Hyalangium sp. s54d21]MDY7232678.1 DEAD/DEAH box helicase family protein [Hyalangium sp. s54d21]